MRRRAAVLVSLSWILGAVAWSCGGDDVLSPVDAGSGGGDATFDGATGSDGSTTTDATSSTDTGTGGDASDASSVDRGPTTIDFSGDPAGLFWEYGTHGGLYIADQATNQIIKWTDAAGFGTTWALPAPQNSGSSLGQIVRELDGTMFVPRSGTGADNTVLWFTNLGDAGDLGAGLDQTLTRQGFTLLPDNTAIDTRYSLDADVDANIGIVATFKLPGTETKLVNGLSRPIAVVYNEGRLYIADGDLGEIIAIGQTGGTFIADAGDAGGGGGGGGDGGDAGTPHGRVFASIDQPNFACAGPDGDLFVTSITGTVYRISAAGAVTNVATGLKQLRGVAFDGAAKRLFVAEHDPAASGAQNTIRIYPID